MGKNVIISTLPNISQNYLPKVNTSNIFANSLVYDDGSSVLINTTTASAFRLDVNGTGRFQGALTGTSATFSGNVNITVADTPQLLLTHSNTSKTFLMAVDGSNAFFRANSTNNILFQYAGGTTALTISGSTGAATFSGNVGINGGSTSSPLTVKVATNQNVRFSSETNTAIQAVNDAASAYVALKVDGSSLLLNSQSGGNVGIGSTSAAVLLTIGKIGTANQIGFYDSGTAKGFIGVSAGTSDIISTDALNDMVIRPSSAGNLLFAIGSTERMRITSGGNVGIGTTSPANILEVSTTSKLVSDRTGVNLTTSNATAADIGLPLVWSSNGTISNYATASITGRRESASGGVYSGYLQFSTTTSAGALTERMRITSGGNVGIGTNNPTGAAGLALALNGGASQTRIALKNNTTGDGTGDGFQILLNTDGEATLEQRENAALTFNTNNTERMRIGSDGAVQMKHTNSFATLRLGGGNGVGEGRIYLEYNGNSSYIDCFGDNTYKDLVISANNLKFNSAGSQRMIITSGGSVGIGLTNPDSRLTVTSGTAGPYGTGTPDIAVGGNLGGSTTALQIYRTATTGGNIGIDAFRSGVGGAPLLLNAANGGNVGIGNTNPQARLDLGSSYGASGEKFLFYNDDNASALAGTKCGFYMDRFSESNSVTLVFPYAPATTSRYHVAYKNTGNTTITDVCYVTYNSTAWTFPSDERMKNVECVIPNALDKIKDLRAVYYTQKRDPEQKRKVGLLAQDLLKVLPEVVDVPDTEFDEEGNQKYMSVALADTIPLLVKAIQELKGENDTLKADIESLKALINK